MARALHRRGELAALVTDFWAPPGSWMGKLPGLQRLRERWHPDLADARVLSMNASMLGFELWSKLTQRPMWAGIMARNAFFQRRALGLLSTFNAQSSTVFSYSYAAADLFGEAKRHGWTTVLGQIDPGPQEERIVAEASRRHGIAPMPAPADYWDEWRKETELADRIVVNSTWSKDCLSKEGIAGEKMVVVPLAYEPAGGRSEEVNGGKVGRWKSGDGAKSVKGKEVRSEELGVTSADVARSYPDEFSKERPMRVLFLGQVNVRKGVPESLEAARMLENEAVEFWLVGGVSDGLSLADVPRNVRVVGAVERGEAERWYREADVFVLPTHSDGFALTQLEAQAHGLPVIASSHCGQVVKDSVNGRILPEVSAKALAQTLHDLSLNPRRLESMARASRVGEEFSLESVGELLASVALPRKDNLQAR